MIDEPGPTFEAMVPATGDVLAQHNDVGNLLARIRPEWQGRSLVERVQKILPVDPSSACQRLFNAAIHDLREKVVIAGIDIAKEAAKTSNLPSIEDAEDVQQYSTSNLVDLCYRMGLLNRAEWRRLHRAYEIRRDLEHEDDEYEAGLEDCVYIFKTTIEIVLSRHPTNPLRVTEVKELVESADDLAPSADLLADYQKAPQPRQEQICRYLVSTALSKEQPDIVRQKAIELLRRLEQLTHHQVRLAIAAAIQERIGRHGLDLATAKVAHAIGAIPYLKQTQIADFFTRYLKRMNDVGPHWTKSSEHTQLLEDLEDVGGLEHCPEDFLAPCASWLVLAYIGEPGGYGMGVNRPVFFSNSAAPIIRRMLQRPAAHVRRALHAAATSKTVKAAVVSKYISRRLEDLLDLTDERP